MYHRILVALDRSSTRPILLDKAISLAKAMDATLMLVHVLSPYDEASPGLPIRGYHSYSPIVNSSTWEAYHTQWQTFEQDRLQELKQLTAAAVTSDVQTEFTQVTGDPGHVICDVAHAWRADLIIVGHRGRSGLSEFLLGSVSNYVMHHAPCSVLVVHKDSVTRTPPSEKAVSLTVPPP